MDEISWICVFQTKKMPLFPLVKSILGALLSWGVTIPIVNFHVISHRCYYYGRRFCIYDLHTYLVVTDLLKKKKKHEKEAWKLENMYWCLGGCVCVCGGGVCSKSYICFSLRVFTDQKCLWHPYSSLPNVLQWSWSTWTDGRNKWRCVTRIRWLQICVRAEFAPYRKDKGKRKMLSAIQEGCSLGGVNRSITRATGWSRQLKSSLKDLLEVLESFKHRS